MITYWVPGRLGYKSGDAATEEAALAVQSIPAYVEASLLKTKGIARRLEGES